jgi:exodeoxyribonuclease-3
LRLLTYNIHRGGVGRVERLAHVINSCQPDIVLLQEATDVDTVHRLAAMTRMTTSASVRQQSLGYLSRQPVVASWHRPRLSRHAFIELQTPEEIRVFGVHLSAIHSPFTEQRRVYELRALLQNIAQHQKGFHVLAGDFNTLAPSERLDASRLPWRLRPLAWMGGRQIRWRTIQAVLDAGYVDAFRSCHRDEAGLTMPTWDPHVRLDYVFVPRGYEGRIAKCEVVSSAEAAAASDHFPVMVDLQTVPVAA